MQIKYKNKTELKKAIDKYFKECDDNHEPYTITGLARHIGLDRKALITYGNKEEYSNTIKDAKLKIEEFNEKLLYDKNVPSVGVIFNLKNNYGWVDKQEIDANVESDLTIKVELTDDND